MNDDNINQSKRRITHHPLTDTLPSPSDLISPDLNARLQNVGSRIRRSVSEGYATHRFSLTSIQAGGQPSINDAPIFRSANDTLHAVYSQFSTSAALAPSDRKRGRMESTVDEGDEQSEDGSAAVQSASVITANDLACSRPIKPLRRTPRKFGQTKSLPATVFGSSSGGDDQRPLEVWEEEDWSESAFTGERVNTQRLE